MTSIAEGYQECERIIKAQARKYAAISGRDPEELLSVANEIFVRAYGKWDPERPLENFIAFEVRCGLIDFTRKYPVPIRDYDPIKDDPPPSKLTPCDTLSFKEHLEKLSDDAMAIVDTVLNRPEVMGIDGSMPPRKIRGMIGTYMRETLKWKWQRIWDVTAELKTAFA